MAKKNAINNETQDLTLDPGASGDSFLQLDINGTGEFRIGVDDTDDSFRISQGSALGTNDTFKITSVGEITKPLQPCFMATVTSQIDNVTGDGTAYTIVWDAEPFDQNSDFDGTSTFTASVTGKYIFNCSVAIGDVGAGHTNSSLYLITSNRNYGQSQCSPAAIRNSSNVVTLSNCVICDMDAADTAFMRLIVSNSTKTVDIVTGGASDPYNWFTGALIC